MYTEILKAWIRGIGIVAVLVGVLAFPVRIGINPERDTSIFHNFADLGLFVEYIYPDWRGYCADCDFSPDSLGNPT
jgi:hypothetical protein